MAGYGDDAGYTAFLTESGLVAPSGGVAIAALRQRGSVYIDGVYGARFSGVPTDGVAQERAWPRTGARAYCAEIPADTIPVAVVQASYYAAYQENIKFGSLTVVATAAGQVKRKKVDVIEIEYATADGDPVTNATPVLSAVEGLLAPFLRKAEAGAVFVV